MVDDARTRPGPEHPDDVDPDVVIRAGVEGQPHRREPAQPGEDCRRLDRELVEEGVTDLRRVRGDAPAIAAGRSP